MYVWLLWVFAAAQAFLWSWREGLFSGCVRRLLIVWPLLLWSVGSGAHALQRCGSRAHRARAQQL